MWKNCKVVVFPTNKKALDKGQLYLSMDSNPMVLGLTMRSFTSGENFNKVPQHLYITSDEEIKEGDWFICNQAMQQCVEVRKDNNYPYKIINKFNGEIQYHSKHWKGKIIATTDKSLELPQPSQQFIEKYIEEYNRGNVITDVLVEYEANSKNIIKYGARGKHIKVNPKDNTITIEKVKNSWTKEEHSKSLSDLGRDLSKHFNLPFEDSFKFTMKWIEENL